jgi:hypothetical protein
VEGEGFLDVDGHFLGSIGVVSLVITPVCTATGKRILSPLDYFIPGILKPIANDDFVPDAY